MFAGRYFPGRYFAQRFFPKVGASAAAAGVLVAPASTLSGLGGPIPVASGTWVVVASQINGFAGAPVEAEGEWVAPASYVLGYGGQPVEADGEWTAPASTLIGLAGADQVGYGVWTAPASTLLGTSGELTSDGAWTVPASTILGYGFVGDGITATGSLVARRSRLFGLAEVPVQRLTLTLDGEVINDTWYASQWNVSKDGSLETANFTIRYPVDSIDVPAPENDQILLLEHPVGGLIYGGKIKKVTRSRLGDGSGTRFDIESGDWMFVARRAMVAPQRFAPTYLFDFAEWIRQAYLDELGIVNIGPLTGGPELPELIIDEPMEVHELLDRCEELTKYPWRINGLQQYAFVEIGSLIWPGGTLDGSNAKLRPEVKVEDAEVIAYNFLWMKLASHPAGDGPFHHNERRTADGVQQVFPVNVIPTEVDCELDAVAEELTTSIVLRKLPPGAKVRFNDTFFINSDPRRYYVNVGGTVDAAGKVTIACDPIELKAEEGTAVKFEPGALINLLIDGVETEFAGSPWVWDKPNHAFINPVAPPPIGTVVRYEAYVKSGGWVRAWETSEPAVQTDIGWFDNSLMVARKIDNEDHWDWAESVAFLRNEILAGVESQRVVTLMTHEHGIYPFIQATLSFPNFGVSGPYICEKVEIGSNDADPELTDLDLSYHCTFRKNYFGKKNFDFWRPVSQMRWGFIESDPPTNFEWTANRLYTFPDSEAGIELFPTPDWQWTDWTEVTPYAFADLVFAAIVIEQTDSAQPYYVWSRHFEVQIARGALPDPVILANFKGHAKDSHYSTDEGGTMRLMIPVDNCPQGEPVWIRLRVSPGGWLSISGPWRIAVEAFAKPLTGNLTTTPYAQEITHSGDVGASLTMAPIVGDWSDWVTVMDESPYDLLLTGRQFSPYSFMDVYRAQVQWAVHNPENAPTEANIVKNEAFTNPQLALGNTNYIPWENPYFMNSGKRLSIRIKNEYEPGGSIEVALSYVRFSE